MKEIIDLELVSTDAMINELHRRSTVFFIAMRPMGENQWDWKRSQSVDGGMINKPEALARVLGLVQIAVADLLKPTLDDIV